MKIGILGGGHLAHYLARAAALFGLDVAIYDPDPQAMALRYTAHGFSASWDDAEALARFAEDCAWVTIEREQVPLVALRLLAERGVALRPGVDELDVLQDRLALKRKLDARLEVGRFRKVSVATDVLDAAQEFGFPVWLKARRGGYDGRAVVKVQRAADAQPALERLVDYGELYAEANVGALRELSVTVVRAANGDMRAYPVVEVVPRADMCHTVLCPAGIDEASAIRATEAARDAVVLLNGVGAYTTRLFELDANEVVVHKVMPRPHESGLYSLEGVITSQFENHLRALLGLPLGDVAQIAPATVSIALVGERDGAPNPNVLAEALQTEGVHVHWYGHPRALTGRRMGHINILGYSTDGAEKVGLYCLSRVHL
ncbi:MAG: ATP-grasp domain-containing protein [Anaerolineae bacterium]|nr:ATP-grasp domain-containing protein [Anaerolineae bacterium]MDW8172848.1 ATP-grasp domain-containing protein [Anaerolineae bacterium]